jgi:PAS domain S-box-containing protein
MGHRDEPRPPAGDVLFNAAPWLVLRFQPEGFRLTFVTSNLGWILGYAAEELIGSELFWEAVVHPEDRPRLASTLSRAIADVVTQIEQESRWRGKDGRYRWFSMLLRIEYDDEARATSIIGYAQDIAERKAAEEALRLVKLEADRASRAKSEFLSRMSHELRTPLNAVLGYAQVIAMDTLSAEQTDSLQQILKGGSHLLELVNEVLDIARIEAGHLSLSQEPVGLAEVIPQVADLVRPLSGSRGIRIVADVVTTDVYVRADRQRLKQVLLNLVSNAVKYSGKFGTVRVSWRFVAGLVRIEVTDSGAGIAREKLALLFHPFERLGAEQSGIEGTGLGLAVSKGLTEAMGGRIGVESRVDEGTTFWIELPQSDPSAIPAPVEMAPAPTSPPKKEASGTVLYVEDNRSNVRLLERIMTRRRGVRLITAPTGGAAIEMARSQRPDLILLDLHLPDMSGEEVLQRLWADPTTAKIPVAVLSADATAIQQQRLLAAGAVAYLTKPMDLPLLLSLLDARLTRASDERIDGGGR